MADRLISPNIVSSESLNNLSDAGERLFWRIVAAATTDQWGRRDGSPRKLRADCIPLLNWEDAKLTEAVEELVREDLITLYFADDRIYISVRNWDVYQRTIARLRKGKSRYPEPQEQTHVGSTGERPVNDHRTIGGRDGLKGLCSSEVDSTSASQSVQSGLAENVDRPEEQPRDDRSLAWFLDQVPGASRRTAAAVSTVVRKYRLPPAALHAALEEMRNGGAAIGNPPGLVVSKLKEYGESGRYTRS